MSLEPLRGPLVRDDDYVAFCDGVRRLCGVDLSQYKRRQMERRIRTFAAKLGHQGLATYLELLSRTPAQLDALLDHITINVSQLWRNPEHWDRLRTTVLPASVRDGRIRVWSAGASYGAEAYSAAAVCLESVPGVVPAVLGTDIDRRMVERARQGVFSAEDARSVPALSLQRWFEPVDGGWRAGDRLRSLVRFEVGDLLHMPVPHDRFDLVLCRNTVIYFEAEVRDALHGRLAGALRRGGHLMVGATERITDPAALGLEPAGPFVYRRA